MICNRLLETHAREVLGVTDDAWQIWLWKPLPGRAPVEYFLLTGAVAPPFRRGKFAGRPNWVKRDAGTERSVLIPVPDHERWCRAWSARTGFCSGCAGAGKTTVTRRLVAGEELTEPCAACGGSGAAFKEAS